MTLNILFDEALSQAENARKAAVAYAELGWIPLPIAIQTKGIPVKGWQELRITTETVNDYFGDSPRSQEFYHGKNPGNVGVLLGHASEGLVDIDLDCPEAVKLAPHFLPPTKAIFGRKSAGWSHRLYYCRGIESSKILNPERGKKEAIAEIRSNKKDGTSGLQTVLPPSIHEGTGETIRWFKDQIEPAEIDPAVLYNAFNRMCAAAILVKHWTEGARHDLSLALAGMLCKSTNWDDQEVANFVQVVIETAGCNDIDKKIKSVYSTAAKVQAGQEVTGQVAMQEILGNEIVKKVAELLGVTKKRGRKKTENAPVPEDVLDQYCYIQTVDRFVDKENFGFFTASSIDRMFLNILGKEAANQMLADPDFQRFKMLTYLPGADISVVDPAISREVSLNMWRERTITPKKGDTGMFYDHMEYIIPDDEIRNHILNFLAHIIQFPGVKIHHLPLIQGKQGIGKSYIMLLLKALLGRHNVKEVSPDQVRSDFTEWLEGVELVVLEEIMGLGKREFTNKMKPKITSDMISVNRKGVSAYEIPNRVNFIAFTNYKDALVLDADDRRFMVYFSDADTLDPEYYSQLFSEIPDIAEAVYHSLLVRDISEFRPEAPPPMTSHKMEMIENAAGPVEQDILEGIQSKDGPFGSDFTTIKAIREWLLEERRHPARDTTPKKIETYLRHLGCSYMDKQLTSGAYKGLRPWNIRNAEKYDLSEISSKDVAMFIKDAETQAASNEPI